MNGLMIHSILEFPFCLIKSTGSTFGYLTGERRLPDHLSHDYYRTNPAFHGNL